MEIPVHSSELRPDVVRRSYLPRAEAAEPAPLTERLAAAAIPLKLGPYARFFKPILDRPGAVVLIVVTAPVQLAVAIMILVSLGRPLFYSRERIGRRGRLFRMYKFRTMRDDRRIADHIREYNGPERRRTHKTARDPRHTSIGLFLRRTGLDELPQLFNVVTGKMSLIGPRPELLSVVEARYEIWQHARHQVRPGLTGLWQVSEREEEGSMYEHTEIDMHYISTLSFANDVRILWDTASGCVVDLIRAVARSDRPSRSEKVEAS